MQDGFKKGQNDLSAFKLRPFCLFCCRSCFFILFTEQNNGFVGSANEVNKKRKLTIEPGSKFNVKMPFSSWLVDKSDKLIKFSRSWESNVITQLFEKRVSATTFHQALLVRAVNLKPGTPFRNRPTSYKLLTASRNQYHHLTNVELVYLYPS